MPLKKGKGRRVISANIKELATSKPGKARAKAITTIAKRRGISKKSAKLIQAKAIALSKAKKTKKK